MREFCLLQNLERDDISVSVCLWTLVKPLACHEISKSGVSFCHWSWHIFQCKLKVEFVNWLSFSIIWNHLFCGGFHLSSGMRNVLVCRCQVEVVTSLVPCHCRYVLPVVIHFGNPCKILPNCPHFCLEATHESVGPHHGSLSLNN